MKKVLSLLVVCIWTASCSVSAVDARPGAIFNRYPDTWKLNVYPTRRSTSFVQRIYDAAIANATTAESSEGGDGVRNVFQVIPPDAPAPGSFQGMDFT